MGMIHQWFAARMVPSFPDRPIASSRSSPADGRLPDRVVGGTGYHRDHEQMAAMTPDAEERTPLVQWRTATRPYGGEAVSGDLDVVACYPGGVLAAVIDGLGHGPKAAAAAGAAAAVLRRQPGETVMDLMGLCHEALRRTRGAVISLASFNAAAATVTWLGVG